MRLKRKNESRIVIRNYIFTEEPSWNKIKIEVTFFLFNTIVLRNPTRNFHEFHNKDTYLMSFEKFRIEIICFRHVQMWDYVFHSFIF